MKTVYMATLEHNSSTDAKLQHKNSARV